jgi:hypothetical protein
VPPVAGIIAVAVSSPASTVVTAVAGGTSPPAATARTASANSPPSGNRAAGSLASARSISARTCGGTSAGIGGGGRLIWASAIATWDSPSKGRVPAMHS